MKSIKDILEVFGIIGFILALIFGIYLYKQGWRIKSIEVDGGPIIAHFEPPSTETVTSFTVDLDATSFPQPTEVPSTAILPLISIGETPQAINFGEWIIVIGQFPSLEGARSYIIPFIESGFPVQVFCRISPSDSTQTPELRAAVIGFPSEEAMQQALPQVQAINSSAYARQFSIWCPNPVQQADYVSCHYVSCP